MISRTIRFDCDESRLRSFLDDRLPEPETGRLAEHLDQCEACRQALERLAAGSRIFEELRASTSEFGPVPPIRPSGMETVGSQSPRASKVDEPIALDFLEPPARPGTLGRLGPYDVTEVLGHGGFGVVLKAFDPALSRFVAIKVLDSRLAVSAAARGRFAREARAAAAVVHENVVAIHAVDSWNGLPYLVMPCIDGPSLQERVDRDGPLSVKEVLRVGMQAARGLAAAHDQGLVHRDIKPSNILLEQGVERVRLSDFGLARAVDDASQTQSGVITGTPQYMSPEQARGEAVDHRSDLFSLGSVLYFTCTGHPPFRADSTPAVLRRVCDGRPRALRDVNPDVADWLAAIIDRLLAKEAGSRFGSATEVAEILKHHLAELQRTGTSAALGATSPAPAREASRNRSLVAIGLTLAALVAAAAGRGMSGQRPGLMTAASGPAPRNDESNRPHEATIIGSGISATKTWEIADFTAVQIGSTFRADITRGDRFRVVTSSDDNLIEHIEVVREGKTLKVGMKRGVNFRPKEPLKAEIVLPMLDGLDVSGASKAMLSGFRSEGGLKLGLHGASQIDGTIDVGDAEMVVGGASRLTLNGSARAARLSVGGASHLRLAEFPLKQCEIQLAGASHARLTVRSDQPFIATVSGASTLEGSVDAANVSLKLSGASSAKLEGKAGSAVLDATGSSRLGLADLVLEQAVVKLSDSSRASVDVRKNLTYQLSSSAQLDYLGEPSTIGTKPKTATVRRRP